MSAGVSSHVGATQGVPSHVGAGFAPARLAAVIPRGRTIFPTCAVALTALLLTGCPAEPGAGDPLPAAPQPAPDPEPEPAPEPPADEPAEEPAPPEPAEPAEQAWAGFVFGPTPKSALTRIEVRNVAPLSPAAQAGLGPGDRIASVDGAVVDPAGLKAVLDGKQPGDRLELMVVRKSGKEKLSITLTAYDLRQLVDNAIQVGARRLAASQLASGGWRRKGMSEDLGADASVSSLCLRALAGLPADARKPHRSVLDKGLTFVLEHEDPDAGGIVANPEFIHFRSYTTALTLQTLAILDREPEARGRLRAWLVAAQLDDGDDVSEYEFGLHGAWNTFDQNGPATLGADMSTTSFCVEALARTGLDEGPTRAQALVYLGRAQDESSGGFSTGPRDSKAGRERQGNGRVRFLPYGSPTADGLRSLLRLGVAKDDPRVQNARRWIADQFDVRKNPGFPADADSSAVGSVYYYYLASLCDGLSQLGSPTIPRSDGRDVAWASLVAKRLVVLQRADGAWTGEVPLMNEDDPHIATPFALIALAACRDHVESKP